MKKLQLAVILMAMCLLMSCGGTPAIETMPNPEREHGGMDLDYITYSSLSELWDASSLIVVGRYKNVAPRSYNISRDLNDVTKPSKSSYYENLVYQFEVEAVLKGDETADVIEVGQFHGILFRDGVATAATFVQPDLDSYKVLFLKTDASIDHYSFVSMRQWLSTAPIESRWTSWEDMLFSMEDEFRDPKAEDWLEQVAADKTFDWDLTPAGQTRSSSRVSYTGAELLALAEP